MLACTGNYGILYLIILAPIIIPALLIILGVTGMIVSHSINAEKKTQKKNFDRLKNQACRGVGK